MPLSEFDRRCRGYHRRQTEAWRRTRWLGTLLVNINRAHGTAPTEQQDLFTLPGDPPPAPPMSAEDLDATLARLAEFDTLTTAA